MGSPSIHEIASAVAAVVSAIGGCFAAVAAFRSAKSAQESAKSADDATRRDALRDLSSTASLVVHECIAIQSIAVELKSEYRTAEVFSGSAENSSLQALTKATQDIAGQALKISADAELFTSGAKSLADAPPGEVDRVAIRMGEHLAATRTFRDELVRKHTAMFAMNSAERSRRLSKRTS